MFKLKAIIVGSIEFFVVVVNKLFFIPNMLNGLLMNTNYVCNRKFHLFINHCFVTLSRIWICVNDLLCYSVIYGIMLFIFIIKHFHIVFHNCIFCIFNTSVYKIYDGITMVLLMWNYNCTRRKYSHRRGIWSN